LIELKIKIKLPTLLLSIFLALLSSIIVYASPDTISISWYNFTISNTSTDTYLDVLVNMTNTSEGRVNACKVEITLEDGTATNYTGSLTALADERNCSATFEGGTNISQTGDFTIYYYGNQTGGNWYKSSTPEKGCINKLVSGWNLVTFTGTGLYDGTYEYLRNISDRLPYCTYVSRWNNQAGWKNYTTYAESTPTVNSDEKVHLGNATWIYCTDTVYYMRKNYLDTIYGKADENITLYVNTSTSDTKWNLVGMLTDATLNETLYPTVYTGHQDNITAVSWYNATLGHYITCVKEFGGELCTAGYNATEITVTKAQAVWMHVEANVTLNRTAM